MLRILITGFRVANNFSLAYFNSTKSLKLLSFFKWLIILGFGFGVAISYMFSYYFMILEYGITTLVLGLAPYLFVGVIFLGWLIITRQIDMIKAFIAFMFLPPTLTTQYGITSDLFLIIILLVCTVEKKNRQRVVNRVACFSQTYALKEVYQRRLSNKNKYKDYIVAFSDLNYIQIEDFTMLREELVKVRNHKLGISETKRKMTFKIKGVLGKTTVVDDMTIVPQKKSLASVFRRGI